MEGSGAGAPAEAEAVALEPVSGRVVVGAGVFGAATGSQLAVMEAAALAATVTVAVLEDVGEAKAVEPPSPGARAAVVAPAERCSVTGLGVESPVPPLESDSQRVLDVAGRVEIAEVGDDVVCPPASATVTAAAQPVATTNNPAKTPARRVLIPMPTSDIQGARRARETPGKQRHDQQGKLLRGMESAPYGTPAPTSPLLLPMPHDP